MVFDGVDLEQYGLIVTTTPLAVLADVSMETMLFGGRDGANVQARTMKPKYIQCVCQISGTTRDALFTNIDAINAVLDPRNGVKLLTLDCWPGRSHYARLNAPLHASAKGEAAVVVQVQFIVPTGQGCSTLEITQSVAISASPTAFDVPASGSVAGNAYCRPVWVLTNTAAGAATAITLSNAETGDTFDWTGSLAQNEQLRVDAERCHCEKSTDGGTTWTTQMLRVTAGSEWPRLSGGASNACTVTGISTGTLGITYRGVYL